MAPAGSEIMAKSDKVVAVHWFRQDLRLHDNPALCAALDGADQFYPVFIFDGKVASSENSKFHRMRFLHESLECLDAQFQSFGGRLYTFQGGTTRTLENICEEWGVTRLTYQEEPEAIWKERDDNVKHLCEKLGVERIAKTGHTLWNPHDIIECNGGTPPLTYDIFTHVTKLMGLPNKPLEIPDFTNRLVVAQDFESKFKLPEYGSLGFREEAKAPDNRFNKWKGGEDEALKLMHLRLKVEEVAFSSGYILPNQYLPELCAPPRSLSAHLKFGCLSVKRFYWEIQQAYVKVVGRESNGVELGVVAQLIWREFFYTMSAQNLKYGQIEGNRICLPIPWYTNAEFEERVEMGRTGYPFVDAIMNQLRLEGWIHHVGRHMVASYLTRGDLWLSWEVGVKIFEKYLLDYDWSICAGNWMWVSSSAFEKALDCPKCFDPVKYGQRMDPNGDYVRRYVPALKKYPLKYLFQPWLAPAKVQQDAGCIVGKDYPARMNDHKVSARECNSHMDQIRKSMVDQLRQHCAPSSDKETRQFVWLPDHMASGTKCSGDDLCDGIAGL
ncbi:cryptochrome-1-like [Watersipora subatra]|uniref:cryptochrome-1-like n=1 Tax=Watersipora subatra TaxID=2589382 RepID=UPI00355C7EDD